MEARESSSAEHQAWAVTCNSLSVAILAKATSSPSMVETALHCRECFRTTGSRPARRYLATQSSATLGLGIDLDEDGITANDPGDVDDGSNRLQNFPELSTAIVGGGNLTVTGMLNSTASTEFVVEFFASTSCDPAGNGEGERFLGAIEVMTDSSGDAAFSPVLPVAVVVGASITSTATSSENSTSEVLFVRNGNVTPTLKTRASRSKNSG